MDDLRARAAALTDLATPVVLRIASTTGLLRHLAREPATVRQLAAEHDLPRPAVVRIVRLLAARGVVAVSSDQAEPTVQATDLGRLLDDGPGGAYATRLDWRGAAGELDRAFVSDFADVIDGHRPDDVWTRFGTDEQFSRSFDEMMRARAVEWTPPVVEHPVWGTVDRVVDLGGGLGHLVTALLDRWPQLHATLVDRPVVARRSAAELAGHRHAARLQVVGGDILSRMPPGADGYLLAHVLHDWDDDHAVRILTTAGTAARESDGAVIVVERVLPDQVGAGDPVTLEAVLQDVRLYVLFGGGERTQPEFCELADRSGLALESVSPLSGLRRLMILRPVDR